MKFNLIHELTNLLGSKKILGKGPECVAYSRDMSIYTAVPDAVVMVEGASDVQKILKFAFQNKIPITPRGAGTSVTGAVIPVKGGIVLDLSGMNRIKEINLLDQYVVVEPGVVCGRLNAALAPTHYFPPDPGSLEVATIGGMISTNASGRSALKYGTTADYVLALEVVLATGEIIHTGHRTPKASTGFDLTRLFVSAEGTMGVITEATLCILPRPEAVRTCIAGFPSLEAAAQAAVQILASGMSLSACELMDWYSLQGFTPDTGLDFPDTRGMLLLEIDGPTSMVAGKIEELRALCTQVGAARVYVIEKSSEREKIWRWRQHLVTALSSCRNGTRLVPMAEDIGVPVSRVPEAIRRSQELAAASGVRVVLFGHAGDGNIHTTFIINPLDREEWEKAKQLAGDLHRLALELGGTISAEHGIGLAKAPFIKQELGSSHALMHQVKNFLDPQDIMNPGKLGFFADFPAKPSHFAFAVPSTRPGSLASLGSKRADRDALLCMMCGFCRAACPIFAVTGREGDNVRGKMQMANLVRTGELALSEEVARKFYLCTTCGACQSHCPAEIDVAGLVTAIRRQSFKSGYLPKEYQAMVAKLHRTGNPYGLSREKRFRRGQFPQGQCISNGMQAEVLVYLGCNASYLDRRLSFSLLRILDLARVPYAVLDDEICCGQPLAQWGGEEAFHQAARASAARILAHSPELVITPCPSCLIALGQLYPQVVDGWRLKVQSIPEYLYQMFTDGKLEFKRSLGQPVIYHDPCLLGRHLGIYTEPRRLLQSIPGVTLMEFPQQREESVCCGGGSGLPALSRELAARMAARRAGQSRESGAQIIGTACPMCKRQLARGIAKNREPGDVVKVLDIAELVLMALE
ncbi:MAG: FAD-binding and (Fe-S)-binding domain-containing protein [Deltaproteobacteria bacterium]|nr:FAD-binding and (Fe-S)-binding domain-containing protein [Deltaproteobacteria bacterium]